MSVRLKSEHVVQLIEIVKDLASDIKHKHRRPFRSRAAVAAAASEMAGFAVTEHNIKGLWESHLSLTTALSGPTEDELILRARRQFGGYINLEKRVAELEDTVARLANIIGDIVDPQRKDEQ